MNFKDSSLYSNKNTRLVYLHFILGGNGGSRREIAKEVGISDQAVRNSINMLKKGGFLDKNCKLAPIQYPDRTQIVPRSYPDRTQIVPRSTRSKEC